MMNELVERVARKFTPAKIWEGDPRYQRDGELERAGASKRHKARRWAREIIAMVREDDLAEIERLKLQIENMETDDWSIGCDRNLAI